MKKIRIGVLLVIMVVLVVIKAYPYLQRHLDKPPLDEVYFEADSNFTYKNKPIHPLLILKLEMCSFEEYSFIEEKGILNYEGVDKLYEDVAFQVRGNESSVVLSENDKSDERKIYKYEYIGKGYF